jgi:hypothetical protein
MNRPQSEPDDGTRRAFLVERYVSPAAAIALAASTAEVARLCAEPADPGVRVRYLYSAYLPADDTCFCLFRAVSADAVRAVNHRAHFALDRISRAVLLQGDHHEI